MKMFYIFDGIVYHRCAGHGVMEFTTFESGKTVAFCRSCKEEFTIEEILKMMDVVV